jgi:hypothetical protein
MEEFFDYIPKAIGVVIDIGERSKLVLAKDALIQFVGEFKTDTEDKVYIYDPKHIDLPRWLSEAVGNVSNYKEKVGFTLDVGIKQAITAISQVSNDMERHIFYVTDRCYPSQNWKLEEGLKLDRRYQLSCNFVVLTFNEECWKSLGTLYESYPNVQMGLVKEGEDMFKLLKEAIE